MSKIHMERCSTPYIIRKFKWNWQKLKSYNTKCWWGCEAKGNPIHCWWECKWYKYFVKQPALSNKVGDKYIVGPSNIFLGYQPRGTSTVSTQICVSRLKWKQPKCPTKVIWIIFKWWYSHWIEYSIIIKMHEWRPHVTSLWSSQTVLSKRSQTKEHVHSDSIYV